MNLRVFKRFFFKYFSHFSWMNYEKIEDEREKQSIFVLIFAGSCCACGGRASRGLSAEWRHRQRIHGGSREDPQWKWGIFFISWKIRIFSSFGQSAWHVHGDEGNGRQISIHSKRWCTPVTLQNRRERPHFEGKNNLIILCKIFFSYLVWKDCFQKARFEDKNINFKFLIGFRNIIS